MNDAVRARIEWEAILRNKIADAVEKVWSQEPETSFSVMQEFPLDVRPDGQAQTGLRLAQVRVKYTSHSHSRADYYITVEFGADSFGETIYVESAGLHKEAVTKWVLQILDKRDALKAAKDDGR